MSCHKGATREIVFWRSQLTARSFSLNHRHLPSACRLHPRLPPRFRVTLAASAPQTKGSEEKSSASNGPDLDRFRSGSAQSLRSISWDDDPDDEMVCQCDEKGSVVSFVRWQSEKSSQDPVDKTDLAAHQQHNYDSPRVDVDVRNQVQLSTYGNHIGENMGDLAHFIETRLQGVIGGVHLLPIYPSSGDGGFAPLRYDQVAPEMGSWGDFEAIAKNYDVLAEFMVNHISPQSEQFQDFLEHGWDSKYASMFINWDEFWPEGRPTKEDLALIRTRKPEPPVLEVTLNSGEKTRVWCTFGPQQIDINPFSEFGKQFVKDSLGALSQRGCKMVRLDAFGYATKKLNTRCFMEEPESTELLEFITKVSEESQIGLLCEVHEEYRTNIQLAKDGFWVYDFALPLLLLHAVTCKTAVNLRHWLRICPRRQITVLDTHDGMGIDDIEGLAQVVEIEQLKEVVTECLGCAPNFKYHYSAEKDKYIGAPHQFNCTYFSALNGDAKRYLLCRAVQFFTPGIPMVYYVGLFAGRNDWDAVDPEEQNTRAINRHRYSLEEADEALQQPVVKALMQLCRARNEHPAYNGQISVPDAADHELVVIWENGHHRAKLTANFETGDFEVVKTDLQEPHEMRAVRYTIDDEIGQSQKSKQKISFKDA